MQKFQTQEVTHWAMDLAILVGSWAGTIECAGKNSLTNEGDDGNVQSSKCCPETPIPERPDASLLVIGFAFDIPAWEHIS